MTTKINVLQVIPKLGYGGAETGCYDIAHYLAGKRMRFIYSDLRWSAFEICKKK